MEFTVKERMVLLYILPKEGDYKTLKILRVLREELSFSEEENKKLNFRQEDNRILWSEEGEKGIGAKNIAVGETAKNIIVEKFNELDKNKKLNEDNLPLYEKFMNNT